MSPMVNREVHRKQDPAPPIHSSNLEKERDRSRSAHDAFAGTASVSRALKAAGGAFTPATTNVVVRFSESLPGRR